MNKPPACKVHNVPQERRTSHDRPKGWKWRCPACHREEWDRYYYDPKNWFALKRKQERAAFKRREASIARKESELMLSYEEISRQIRLGI